jgi:molybdate transport system ATP-binding protein
VAPHARRTALLGQDPLLFPHLSALDNVAFGPRSAGGSRATSRAAATRMLAELQVTELAERRPGELSGGQAQRVAVARALAADPEVLLLDEPMAALDVDVAPALRQTLRRILPGRTTVIVTHDVLDALMLADRVVVIEDGRVAEEGPTAEVLARPRSGFAARLSGLNLVRGQWSGEHVTGLDGVSILGLAEPGLVVGESVVATFRPSAVAVYREGAGGSPRNRFGVRVDALEPVGEVIRVRAGALAADITPAAVADLDLVPGLEVTFSVKATEVSIYPVPGLGEGAVDGVVPADR